ncbi:MAG: FdtA/QdtA family cupin domain-containing protein [Candidatus Uhrbacteria bacterium]|nr:FdtA/QdtA family cupin domain-containing protein [Candidatus Uhrbacteria bacterium]
MKPRFQLFELQKIPTSKFLMNPVELKEYIDFEVKRVYFITQPVEDSGAHCHTDEKEFFILIQGTCDASIDRGNGLEEFSLQAPTSALYVAEYVWHQFKNFSPDAILLALSSTNYDPVRHGYIENYEDYLKRRDSIFHP